MFLTRHGLSMPFFVSSLDRIWLQQFLPPRINLGSLINSEHDLNHPNRTNRDYLCIPNKLIALRSEKQMRQAFTIFLILAFAAQSFHRTFIVMDYYVNTSAFAKNCENKEVPEMKCKGKCQMMKKLKEEEKKDRQNPERKAENKHEVISSKSFYTTLDYSKENLKPAFNLTPAPQIIIGASRDIFHPPSFS